MAKSKTLRVYNISEAGVDVDTDNLHVSVGSLRQSQNIHRNPLYAGSIITRDGLRNLNSLVLGSGPVLGGVTIPAFESGSGEASLFLGFGD